MGSRKRGLLAQTSFPALGGRGVSSKNCAEEGTGMWVPQGREEKGIEEPLEHLSPVHLPPAPTGQGCEHKN